MNYQCDNFDEFVKENWVELIEYAEEATGELYSGQEPLLTKEGIIEEAQEIWNEKQGKYK